MDADKLKKVLAVLEDALTDAKTVYNEYRTPGDPVDFDDSDYVDVQSTIKELIKIAGHEATNPAL